MVIVVRKKVKYFFNYCVYMFVFWQLQEGLVRTVCYVIK